MYGTLPTFADETLLSGLQFILYHIPHLSGSPILPRRMRDLDLDAGGCRNPRRLGERAFAGEDHARRALRLEECSRR